MPWGAWVTCEETVNGPDVGPDFTGASNVPLHQAARLRLRGAGQPPSPARASRTGSRSRSAGRFAHEAVSFDPQGGHLYLTEDNFGFASGFYRYTPPSAPDGGRPSSRDGGTLQMLKVKGVDNAHLEAQQVPGTTYDVEWVEIAEPDVQYPYTPGEAAPTTNNTALVHVGSQGWAQGAAYFSRLEGQVYSDGVVFFTSTQGGGAAEATATATDAGGYGNGTGQVWAYDTARAEAARGLPVAGPAGRSTCPTTSPPPTRGTLVVCEDNVNDNFIRGLSPEGDLWDIALNRLTQQHRRRPVQRRVRRLDVQPRRPDALRQHPGLRGMTFAIWGPWGQIGV